jgi:hypothetical protein
MKFIILNAAHAGLLQGENYYKFIDNELVQSRQSPFKLSYGGILPRQVCTSLSGVLSIK